MTGRVRLPDSLAELIRTELERTIYESCLHKDDELIARRYIIDKWCQIDIAAELGWERSTISKRMPGIMKALERTAFRLKSQNFT